MTADQIALNTLWAAIASSGAAVFSCFVSIGLVLLTASYVKLTHEMLLEAKAIREPSVYFDLEFPNNSVNIVVGNFGELPAKNCNFEVVSNTSGIQTIMGQDLSSMAPFRHAITFLAPKRIYKYGVGYIYDIGQEPNQVLHVRCKFENQKGKMYVYETLINMAQFSGVLFESFRDPSYSVAEAIEKMETNRQLEKSLDFSSIGPKTVPCPCCKEPVRPEARKCKHCMETIEYVDRVTDSSPDAVFSVDSIE